MHNKLIYWAIQKLFTCHISSQLSPDERYRETRMDSQKRVRRANINYLLTRSQMPRRQWWQLCQESLSALYHPDEAVTPPSSTHTETKLVKLIRSLRMHVIYKFDRTSSAEVREEARSRGSIVIISDTSTHTFFINMLTLTLGECQRMLPGYTTPPCDCLAPGQWKHTHTHTHSLSAMRTHLLWYQIDANTIRSNNSSTNTESRWRRIQRARWRLIKNTSVLHEWRTNFCSRSLSPVCLTCVLDVQEHAAKALTHFKHHCRCLLLIKQLLKNVLWTPSPTSTANPSHT